MHSSSVRWNFEKLIRLVLGQLIQCFLLVMITHFITFFMKWVFLIKICGFKRGEQAVTQDERKHFRVTWHLFSTGRHWVLSSKNGGT